MRKLVFKSSAHYYGCARDDPAFFTEDMKRTHPPATPLKRDIVEAEAAVADFADKNDARDGHDDALLQRAGARHPTPATRGCSRCPPCR